MTEQPVCFGAGGRLVGTLARPAGAETEVGILLTNAGVIHRVGPHRINVKIARQAAAIGCASLRFDLSGLGDSQLARESVTWEEQAVRDMRAAMDYMQSATRVRRFVIFGICSGADNGLAAAAADSRVAGLFLVDGYAYPSWKTPWIRIARAFRPAHILRRLPGWLMEWGARIGSAVMRILRAEFNRDEADFDRNVPTRAGFADQLQKLVDRSVAVYLLYSGSLHTSYNYAGQFADVFGRERFFGAVRCDFARDIDHTLTTLHAQQALAGKIVTWLRQVVPGSNQRVY